MKVTIINHSDTKGGASVVSYRLMRALREAGVDACMLVGHKGTDDQNVHVATPHWKKKAAFYAEHLDIFLHNGLSRKNLFKVSLANFGLPLSSHPLVKNADVVILGWINQGLLSLKEIGKIKAPLIWNMHDMWNMTGICHHAGICSRYEAQCDSCPLLHEKNTEDFISDLSTTIQNRKSHLYNSKKIVFTAVSNWLLSLCKKSSLLEKQDVRAIPNAFPIEDFNLHPKKSRQELGLPSQPKLIIMGAARLDDPIKGFGLAIDALNKIAHRKDVAAVFFGDLRDATLLDALKMPHAWLGKITDKEKLSDLYAHASVVFSSSHYETLPGTLIEGMAAGCVPVTFGQGGQSDIVKHLSTGYIAQHPSTQDLAKGLEWALDSSISPESLRQEMENKFSAKSIAKTYIFLFKELTNDLF